MTTDPGNGREQRQAAAEDQQNPQPRFAEDDTGAVMDSGPAICRFNAQRGGRLERWQWRTLPSAEAGAPDASHGRWVDSGYARPGGLAPHSAHRTPYTLDLVDPTYGALTDHFMPLGTKPEELAAGTYQEYGDFAEGAFQKQVVDSGGEIRIGLLRDGAIRAGKRVAEVRMAKSAALRPGASDISVLYRVINSSRRPLQILFAVEFNLIPPGLDSLLVPGSAGYYLVDGVRPENDPSFGSMGVSPSATHVALVNPDGEMALQLGWDRECDLWRLPGQDGGPSVRLLTVWRIQLPPRDNWAMGMWLAPG